METNVRSLRMDWLRATLIAAALLAYDGRANAAETTVNIENFTFEPQVLTVPVGTKVVWVNNDDIPHVVAEKDRKFRSQALDTGDSFTQTFTVPGTIEYYCSIHPMMTGKIIVAP
jgi:plastocyanin